jgi:hypothetical protein
MKRKKSTRKMSSKVPERIIPIVDAVVEMVFARLEEAAAKAKRPGGAQATSKEPHHDGLAGALADLLLAGLTHQPVSKKKKKEQRKDKKKKKKEQKRKGRSRA